MYYILALSALAFVGAVNVGTFVAPGPNDIRSPCPGLNALANHGYLPRDGRNIHALDIIFAMREHLGIAADFGALQVTGATFRGAIKPLPGGGLGLQSFEDLNNSHNVIEHDASYTRDDAALGSNSIRNITLIREMLAFSKDGVVLTPQDLAAARHARFKDSVKRNPKHTLEKKQVDGCLRESTLTSFVLGDKAGNVRVDWLKEFWENERLPVELGWSAPKPPHGIIESIISTNMYRDLAKKNNAVDKLPVAL